MRSALRGNLTIIATLLFMILAVLLTAADTYPQSTTSISRKCPGPTPAPTNATVTIEKDGDVQITPCDGKSVYVNGTSTAGLITSINGLTAASQTFASPTANDTASWSSTTATHTLRLPITAVSGSSRTSFYPYFDAANTLAKSPFSFSGTQYAWETAGLDCVFCMDLRPSATGGFFTVGDGTTNRLEIESTGGTGSFKVADLLDLGGTTTTINGSTPNMARFSGSTTSVALGDPDGNANGTTLYVNDTLQRVNGGVANAWFEADAVAGVTHMGDINGEGSGTVITINDTNKTITGGNSAAQFSFNGTTSVLGIGDIAGAGNSTTVTIDDANRIVMISNGSASLESSAFDRYVRIGDVAQGNNGVILKIDDDSVGFSFLSDANSAFVNFGGAKTLNYLRTITPGGTTGAQTINRPAGTVNFAAAATAITVTNNTVTANSIIIPVVRTLDATCTTARVVASAGSFVITMNAACTAETSVGFFVTN